MAWGHVAEDDDRLAVVWQEDVGGLRQVFVAVFDQSGGRLSQDVAVTNTDFDDWYPAVAWSGPGAAVLLRLGAPVGRADDRHVAVAAGQPRLADRRRDGTTGAPGALLPPGAVPVVVALGGDGGPGVDAGACDDPCHGDGDCLGTRSCDLVTGLCPEPDA